MNYILIISFLLSYTSKLSVTTQVQSSHHVYRDTAVRIQPDTLLLIQKISIKNTYVKKYLEKFIERTKQSNELFSNGFGYIELSNTYYYKNRPVTNTGKDLLENWKRDTLVSFKISLSSRVLLDEPEPDAFLADYYPSYYALVDDCPILLYDDLVDVYSPEPCHYCYKSPFSLFSKRLLQTLVNNRLKRALEPGFKFISLDGKAFTLTAKELQINPAKEILKKAVFSLNISYQVYILRDGTYIQNPL